MKDEKSGHYIHEATGRPYLAVSMPPHGLRYAVYRLERKIQPVLCKVGFHRPCDVVEIDGSIIDGYCDACSKLIKPRNPREPDPHEAEGYELLDRLSECFCQEECCREHQAAVG